ncbi:MAG: hypothetical protein ACLUAR_19810 [Pilosibacter sp.]
MKRIAILGSTGSIGTQTLDVVRANGDIEVVGIAAGRNIDALENQIFVNSPRRSAVSGTRRRQRAGGCPCGRYNEHEDRLRHGRTFGDCGHGRI